MQTRRLATSLLALSLIGGCASSGAVDSEKSPFVATLIAILPGFFVHGAGHMYAGKNTRGQELLEEEGWGTGALILGAGLGGIGWFEHTEADRSKNTFDEVMNRIGEASSFAGSAVLTTIGLAMFFDSWIKDIAGAGSACEERNRELRRQYDPGAQPLEPDTADVMTAGAPSR